MDLMGLPSRCCRGWSFLEALKGKSVSLLFQLLEAACIPGLVAPSEHIAEGPLQLDGAHLDNPGESPPVARPF